MNDTGKAQGDAPSKRQLERELERCRAQLAGMEQDRRRWQTTLENVREGFIGLDRNLVVTYLNRAAEELLGRRREDVEGQALFDAFPEARGSVFEEKYTEALGTQKPVIFETFFGVEPYDDWYSVRVYPCAEGLSVYFQVTTSQKESEAALQRAQHRYRAITEKAVDSIFCKDAERRYTFVNRAMAKLFGGKAEALLGKTPEEVFEPEMARIVRELDERSFRGELVDEIRQIVIGDREYVFHTIQGPLEHKDGIPISISGIVRDITEVTRAQRERERLEVQVIEAQKLDAIGTLAGGIAHDFNNMLGVITGNVSYALSMGGHSQELVEVLTDVQEGARKATGLTQQLLTFAKGGAPVKEACNVNAVIKDAASFVSRGAAVRCDYELAGDLNGVEADVKQLHQAVNNLVINAIQAMPNGGKVHLATENVTLNEGNPQRLPPGPYVCLRVRDEGTGISRAHLHRIFEPYFTTKPEGSGLGLATTYSIFRRHDGHIEASSAEGRGATLTGYLPASADVAGAQPRKTGQRHAGRGRLLVMDDQEAVLRMLDRLLKGMGYATVGVRDGSEAVVAYREALEAGDSFVGVILDLTVPGGLGGVDTMAQLRQIDPGVRGIVSSGYANDAVMANYRAHGFCAVASKPYTRNELADILNRVLGGVEGRA